MTLFYAVLAFFGGMMIRWHVRMRANRRLILCLLEKRGWSTEQDLEENAGGELHLPTLQITLNWIKNTTHEVAGMQDEPTKPWRYRLTTKGAKVVQLWRNASQRSSC